MLDFGCGAGGFLLKSQSVAAEVVGIELESRVRDYWAGRLPLYESVVAAPRRKYDLITAFHVVEHLIDPKVMLQQLSSSLSGGGRLIVEVPSSEDALLTLFDNGPFQHFTYWSQHLYLFNAETLRKLAEQAGLRVLSIQQFQRYPLSNHLHWLSMGVSGGHKKWGFLDSPELNSAYANALAAIGKCDTLIGHFEVAK